MTLKTALTAAVLGLASPLLWAEDEERWYQVELLVFENPDYGAESPEQWPTYPDLTARSPSLSITPDSTEDMENSAASDERQQSNSDNAARPTPFEPLSEAEQQLVEARKALEQRRGFRVLYHQAWIQPVPDRDNVVPIRIQGGDTYGQQAELQGYIDLYVERYLHLTTDLQLVRYAQTDNPFRLIDDRDNTASESFEPFSGLSLGGQPSILDTAGVTREDDRYFVATESVRMQQRRRMRSTEVHYLDNPEFGLLVLTTPIEFNDSE